jgi:hypothetical protein
MRAHLIRKGAIIPKELRIETNPYEIHRGMLGVDKSEEEDWEDYFRAEYWERWMLWSYPDVNKAKLYHDDDQGCPFHASTRRLLVFLIAGRSKTTGTPLGIFYNVNLFDRWCLAPLEDELCDAVTFLDFKVILPMIE